MKSFSSKSSTQRMHVSIFFSIFSKLFDFKSLFFFSSFNKFASNSSLFGSLFLIFCAWNTFIIWIKLLLWGCDVNDVIKSKSSFVYSLSSKLSKVDKYVLHKIANMLNLCFLFSLSKIFNFILSFSIISFCFFPIFSNISL